MNAERRRALTAASLLVAALGARPARADVDDSDRPGHKAQLPGSDGVYGRLDGNLAVAGSAGAELESGQARGSLRLSLHYLWTAGLYGRYSDAFGQGGERAERVASLGVDLRPLFLPRFALDLEQGPAWVDLTLDSLSLTAGAYFAEPRGRDFGAERGFETGLGFGLPLSGAARGPWLEARAERRFADRGSSAWLFTVALAFHTLTWTTDARR